MRDVLDELTRWWAAGTPFGMATVVGTWDSAPRPAGATMVVGSDGTVAGSVSGGCVEADVYELARAAAVDGAGPVLRRYGISDDDALAAGLTCGGVLDVFVERVDPAGYPELAEVASSIRAGTPVAVVTCVRGPAERLGRRMVVWPDRTAGSLGADVGRGHGGSERATDPDPVVAEVRAALDTGWSGLLPPRPDGDSTAEPVTLFVASFAAPPRLLVFGAIDFAAAMARLGAFLGFHVTVCDARPVFTTARRFPDADEVVVDWPHRYLRAEADAGRIDPRTAVCVLTHDPRFDVPLLVEALRMPLAYVGAMGSRRTHKDRLARLREAGLGDAELDRLAAPIGLDLGGRTPEETAVSIAAEIIAARSGGTGAPLRALSGRIHGSAPQSPAGPQ